MSLGYTVHMWFTVCTNHFHIFQTSIPYFSNNKMIQSSGFLKTEDIATHTVQADTYIVSRHCEGFSFMLFLFGKYLLQFLAPRLCLTPFCFARDILQTPQTKQRCPGSPWRCFSSPDRHRFEVGKNVQNVHITQFMSWHGLQVMARI